MEPVRSKLDLEEDATSPFCVVGPAQAGHIIHTLLVHVHVTRWPGRGNKSQEVSFSQLDGK